MNRIDGDLSSPDRRDARARDACDMHAEESDDAVERGSVSANIGEVAYVVTSPRDVTAGDNDTAETPQYSFSSSSSSSPDDAWIEAIDPSFGGKYYRNEITNESSDDDNGDDDNGEDGHIIVPTTAHAYKEALRRRRKRLGIAVASFFPLVAASVALGLFLLGVGARRSVVAEMEAAAMENAATTPSPTVIESSSSLPNLRATTSPTASSASASPTEEPTPSIRSNDVGPTPSFESLITGPTAPSSPSESKTGKSVASRPNTSITTTASPPLLDVGNNGKPNGAFPMDECQGDCDADADCMGMLVCYQRKNTEPIPGCSGEGSAGTDYCIIRPENYLVASDDFPLGRCTGDCDSDGDCELGLACEQRNDLAEIPGCVGPGIEGMDYCTSGTVSYPFDSKTFPLGPCEGDCDSNDDCKAGLVCEHRDGFEEIYGDGFEEIYGCEGTGANGGDFCRYAEATATAMTTALPTPPTVWPSNASATAGPSATSLAACIASGEACFNQKICCNGICEKDDTTGEGVCPDQDTPDSSPGDTGDQLSETCLEIGEPCEDKNECCGDKCKRDKVTKEKVCS